MIGQVQVKSYPYVMNIDPISICQIRCPECPTGVENESKRLHQPISFRKRATMSVDFFESLMEEVGDYIFDLELYNWGEPFLHRQLPAFVWKAKKHQICCVIHTNLSLNLSDTFFEELLLSGVDVIATSIDGFSQASYETYRRGGNFELAKKNIKRLAELRSQLGLKTEIIWNFLVFRFNESELGFARKYCDQIGVQFNRREAYIHNPEWLPSYRKHEAKLITSKQKQEKKVWLNERCNWHYISSVINSDGSVSPCCAPWDQKYDFGMIEPGITSFADIWNNDLYRNSRTASTKLKLLAKEESNILCLQCPYGTELKRMYGNMDDLIIDQYHKVFRGQDQLLDEGFRQISDQKRFLHFNHVYGNVLYDEDSNPTLHPKIDYPINKNFNSLTLPAKWRINQTIRKYLKPLATRIINRYPSLYAKGYIARHKLALYRTNRF